jgi:hypothetical protein
VADFCENDNKPSAYIKKAGHCLTSRMTISFSKNILHHGVLINLFIYLFIYFTLCSVFIVIRLFRNLPIYCSTFVESGQVRG